FMTWREELETVQDLGAFRTVERNLIPGEGPPEPVQVAEMSAAGFRLARVPPLLGRYLLEEDERPGASPVVVIGYDAWQNRFEGDPAIVGRDVRLGGTLHAVVGVMPEGFAFPENHRFWTPLRADPAAYERREGPAIFIFGRLAPGVTMEQAQAELEAIGRRTAAAFPETHAQLRPMVMPYTHSLTDIQGISLWEVAQMQLMMSLLLLVVALNVAVLVYARTATRQGEIAVRSALGASRGRIMRQLFAEALVLSLVAAAAGLALAQVGIRLGTRIMEMEMEVGVPFWMDYGLRPVTVLYTVGLAVLAAIIVGVLPALQATGRRLQSDLRQLGGGTGMRLGKTWTALIVAQIAIAVALLPAAAAMGWDEIQKAATRPTYPAEEFLAASLTPETGGTAEVGAQAASPEGAPRFGERLAELMRRLEAEPEVAGVTFRASLPGRGGRVQIEGVPAPPESPSGHLVSSFGVHPSFFEVFGARVLTGRPLETGDLGEEATAVIVNQAFMRQLLGGGNALGRRIRHVGEEEATGSRRRSRSAGTRSSAWWRTSRPMWPIPSWSGPVSPIPWRPTRSSASPSPCGCADPLRRTSPRGCARSPRPWTRRCVWGRSTPWPRADASSKTSPAWSGWW
ncbi:MAG TPA: ABC transporter permease, partial [Thermoleophilaceae bacterium]|nr:ABC transporter permease [Thermoleophilaceae bacterium]